MKGYFKAVLCVLPGSMLLAYLAPDLNLFQSVALIVLLFGAGEVSYRWQDLGRDRYE
jgi:hypothetical protein